MQKSFQYKNADIQYAIYGKGRPVVLLHGFGEDSRIWNNQVQFLKEHCLLIIPDLPGSGKSGILKTGAVSVEDYAGCIFSLLEHEQVPVCIVLGHSMGGYITLAFAQKYSFKLKGFGLVHSTAFADSEEKKENRRKGVETIKEYGAYAFLKNTIPNLFSADFKKNHPDTVEQLIENGQHFTTEALMQYYEAMMHRPDTTHVLKSSEVPVLFILGTEDVAAPLNDVLQQVHLPRVSYIHIVKNVGHMGMLEATEQINNHLLDFIRSLESE